MPHPRLGKCNTASARISTSLNAALLATTPKSNAAGRAMPAVRGKPQACRVSASTCRVKPQRCAMNKLPAAMAPRWPYIMSSAEIGPASDTYKGEASSPWATRAQTDCKSGQVISTRPSGLSTRTNYADTVNSCHTGRASAMSLARKESGKAFGASTSTCTRSSCNSSCRIAPMSNMVVPGAGSIKMSRSLTFWSSP